MTSSIRTRLFSLVALIALSVAVTATPPPGPSPFVHQVMGQTGGSYSLPTPAHDPASAPAFAWSTQVTCDLTYAYSIQNPTTSWQILFLNQPGSYQFVDTYTPTGSPMGSADFALPQVYEAVPPLSSTGVRTVTVTGLTHSWQTHLQPGLTDFDGPVGSLVDVKAEMPASFIVLQSGACTVRQGVVVNATVTAEWQ